MQTTERPNGAGVKIVHRVLADGTIKEYCYKRSDIKPRRTTGALRQIFNEYTSAKSFTALSPKWQRTSLVYMRLIEDELGWMTRADLEKVDVARHRFYKMRDKFADTPHKADHTIAVLSAAMAWAYDRGMVSVNHCVKIKRLTSARDSRHRDKYYTEDQENAVLAGPQYIRDLYEFALYTGLRLGDICSLPPSAIGKDGWLRWRPSKTRRKTNVEVCIPTFAMPPLQAVLKRLNGTSERLLARKGRPWRPNFVSDTWRVEMAALGMKGMRFHDIRHTTSTRLVLAGCTEAERAIILGHATADGTGAIYTARVKELALNAYRKWWKLIEDGAANEAGADLAAE